MVSKKVIIIIIAALVIVGLAAGLLAWGLTSRESREGPVISTNKGSIRGLIADDGEYYKFLGIPYALVDPESPFGSSTPHPGFDSIFDANKIATPCIQIGDNREPLGDIQCLELDIYVPQTANTVNKLPVLVWIHGGNWVEGSSQQEGSRSQFLLRNDVIVVAFNYRLGVYGFLCIDIPEAPGNQGLKDQVLALRWINENIEAFGGDANKVTIFGDDSGGMSTNLHLYSTSEKLYNQVIIQSGPALSYWLFVPSDHTVPFRLAEYFNYNASNVQDAMSYLSSLNPHEVAIAGYDLNISRSDIPGLTQPCIEQTFQGVDGFILEHPMNIRYEPKVATTRILIGYNDKELGSLLAQNATFFETYSFAEQFYLGFPEEDDFDEALTFLRKFYIGDEDISYDVRRKLVDYASDMAFAHSTHRMINQFVNDGSPAVYSYVFSHSGQRNVLKSRLGINETGAIHTDELGYLFDLAMFPDSPNSVDQIVINRMTTMWTNFAKHGDPTPEVTDLLPIKWTPVTSTTRPHLDINDEITLQGRPIHARKAYLDLFYRMYGRYQMWHKDLS